MNRPSFFKRSRPQFSRRHRALWAAAALAASYGLLSGCAPLPLHSPVEAAPQSEAQRAQTQRAQAQSTPPRPTVAASHFSSIFKPEPLSMGWIGDTLRQIALDSQAAANAEQQRLQTLGAQRTPADKLKLAYLLMARAAPTTEEASQAQDLLKGLDNQTEDPASKQFIRVMQRLTRQTLDLSQLRADLARSNKQVIDLQDKIGQIKNLEVELQDRAQSRPGIKK